MTPSPPTLDLLAHSVFGGSVAGLPQPSLRARVAIDVPGPAAPGLIERLDRALDAQLVPLPAGIRPSVRGLAGDDATAAWIASAVEAIDRLLVRLQETAGLPVACGLLCEVAAASSDSGRGRTALLTIPGLSPRTIAEVLPWALDQITALAADAGAAPAGVETALARFSRIAPGGINTRWLLQAAYGYRVPVLALGRRLYQYGWGSRSRWMDSTTTDSTSSIAVAMARNKAAAHAMLARAGLPVPQQAVVQSLDEALAAAQRIGYPVVVKPLALDGGTGVSAGIEDEEVLRRCHERAAAHGQQVIVEKHVDGHDHRLGVVHGRLAWATWREPGGVHGDGRHTVAELVEIVNRDPNRGTQPWSNMRPLVIDDEALDLLRRQGLEVEGVPAAGRFVRFRRVANVSAGGTPTPVLDRVHPDNAALAIRAASVFRLDFAGIDFICPDITRSWLEVGGAICEINGQPQFSVLGPQAPLAAIRGLVHGDGRIPAVLVMTSAPGEALAAAVAEASQPLGLRVGTSTEHGLRIDGRIVRLGRRSPFADARALLLHREVDAIVMVTDVDEWRRTGSPFDAVDLLLVAEDARARRPRIGALMGVARQRALSEAERGAPAELAGQIARWLVGRSAAHRSVRLG